MWRNYSCRSHEVTISFQFVPCVGERTSAEMDHRQKAANYQAPVPVNTSTLKLIMCLDLPSGSAWAITSRNATRQAQIQNLTGATRHSISSHRMVYSNKHQSRYLKPPTVVWRRDRIGHCACTASVCIASIAGDCMVHGPNQVAPECLVVCLVQGGSAQVPTSTRVPVSRLQTRRRPTPTPA